MGLYPVGLELSDQEVLVVGGGEVASRKAESLLEAGAKVTVMAPAVGPGMLGLVQKGAVQWWQREFREGDLEGFVLAMAATDCEAVNRLVSAEARRSRIPVNVCDVPELCTFIVPAVVKRGPLTVAIFTGGKSPMMARKLREELQQQFGPEYAELLELLGALRPRLMALVADPTKRQEIYRRLVYSDALELIRLGKRDQVEAMAEALIASLC